MLNSQELEEQINSDGNAIVKALWLFPIYRFVSLTADFMVQFAVPIIVYQLTNSVSMSGISFFCEWLPRILLVPILGKYVDNISSQKQFYLVDTLRITLLAIVGFVSYLPMLILLLSIFSIVNGYAYLVVERSVRSFTQGNRSGKAQAKLQAADSIGQVAGPAIAGSVLSFSGFNMIIVIGVCFFLTGIIVIRNIQFPVMKHTIKTTESRYIAFKILFSSKKLVRLTILTMMINLIEGITLVVLPAIMIDKYGKMPWGIGGLVGAATGFSALFLYSMTYILQYIRLDKLAIMSGIVMLLSALTLGLVNHLIIFATAFIAFIVGRTVFTVYMRTERMNIIPHEHLGKTISVMISCILLPMPLSGLIAGVLGNVLLPQMIILTLAIFSILMTVVVNIYYRKTRW